MKLCWSILVHDATLERQCYDLTLEENHCLPQGTHYGMLNLGALVFLCLQVQFAHTYNSSLFSVWKSLCQLHSTAQDKQNVLTKSLRTNYQSSTDTDHRARAARNCGPNLCDSSENCLQFSPPRQDPECGDEGALKGNLICNSAIKAQTSSCCGEENRMCS